MRHHSGPFLNFLAYYMGIPSDQFLHLLWRPPYVFFSYYMGAPRIISLHTIFGPPDHFLRLLYGAPQISFFINDQASHTIWGPLSDQFHSLLYGVPPQISFFACDRRGGGTTDFSFFTKYKGAPSDQFLRLLDGAPSG